MKAYILIEEIAYECTRVIGAYGTPEAAMASKPDLKWDASNPKSIEWDDNRSLCLTIEEWEIEGALPSIVVANHIETVSM